MARRSLSQAAPARSAVVGEGDGEARAAERHHASTRPLRVAQLPVADEGDARSLEQGPGLGAQHEVEVVDPAGPGVADGPQLGGVDGGVDVDLGDAGRAGRRGSARWPAGLPMPGGVQTKRSGNSTPSSAARSPEREADGPLGRRAGEADRQAELDGELEVDVEELGPQLQHAHVGVEVADVEAPQDRPLDLGPALPADLVEVGVVPHVDVGAGEAAVAVEQRRGLGDRPPAVQVVLGVEGEVHADVLAPVVAGGLAGPRARDHERGAGGDAVCAGPRRRRRWRRGRAEVVAVDDEQAGVGGMPEPLGEGRHGRDATDRAAGRCRRRDRRTRPTARARRRAPRPRPRRAVGYSASLAP